MLTDQEIDIIDKHKLGLIHEIDSLGHSAYCCGACEVCLSACWGYHGPERRKSEGRRRSDTILHNSLEATKR